MILFVFEGEERERQIFKTIEYLFFQGRDSIVCSFGNNIYELYRQLKEMDGGDIVSVLRENNSASSDSPFSGNERTSDFSEIFLFFDYDFQNKNLTLEEMNSQLAEMLEMFGDETDNGKLYINYPMVEALQHTKRLPDDKFVDYTVSRKECMECNYKEISARFSDYSSLDFIVLPSLREPRKNEIDKVSGNWEHVKNQNVAKANLICTGKNGIPSEKECVSQQNIFQAQLEKYIAPSGVVSILCAFPLFLFEYFK